IDHVDLLAIRRDEKVEVEIPVISEGELAPGETLLMQDADTILVLAPVLEIPEEIVVSVEGAELGHQVTAADIQLPSGLELADDPELLVFNVVVAEEEGEPEEDAEGAEVPATEVGATAEGAD